jgi:hypothetical protein
MPEQDRQVTNLQSLPRTERAPSERCRDNLFQCASRETSCASQGIAIGNVTWSILFRGRFPTVGIDAAHRQLDHANRSRCQRGEGPAMALERELETFRAKLPELKIHEGKFVLIHGEDVVEVFTSYEDAIKQGYSLFKLEPFLVKRISSIEQAQFISRFVDPCSLASAT